MLPFSLFSCNEARSQRVSGEGLHYWPVRASCRSPLHGSRTTHHGLDITARGGRGGSSIGDAVGNPDGSKSTSGDEQAAVQGQALFDLTDARELTDMMLRAGAPPSVDAREGGASLDA